MPVTSFEDRVKIMDWLDTHREEATVKTPKELIPIIQADIAIEVCTVNAIKTAAKVRGVSLRNRKKPEFKESDRFTVAAVLAKSIRQLANEMGVELEFAEELKKIISRQNLHE